MNKPSQNSKVKPGAFANSTGAKSSCTPLNLSPAGSLSVESIITKSQIRHIPMERLEEEMSDIAGLRIMCQFVEDIHQVVQIIRNRKDMKVLIERDYITNKRKAAIAPITW